jgi:hypothetical protein
MRSAILLAAVVLGACVPPPQTHSVDLSAVRIGAQRSAIETALGVPSQSEATEGRVVAVYRYGPHVEPGRVVACPALTLGMELSCMMLDAGKTALAQKAAEDRARQLGESLLAVIYSTDGRAEWVIFAGSPGPLARMDQLIAAAECGDTAAQAEIARSYALGADGLPFDREEAYRWAHLASRGNGVLDEEPVKGVTATIAEPRRQAIDQATAAWRPRRPCP